MTDDDASTCHNCGAPCDFVVVLMSGEGFCSDDCREEWDTTASELWAESE